MQHPLFAALLSLAGVAGLAGCASSVKLDETPIETRTPKPVGGGVAGATPGTGATTGGAPQSGVATVDLAKANAGAAGATALGRTVYFDFDSFVVKDDHRALVDGHAKALAAQKAKRMVIEGHTDERGGREYNLALGQKRAEAVTRQMVLLGVTEGQLEAVSFGKERPAAPGSDEAAWAKNRRAELKDR